MSWLHELVSDNAGGPSTARVVVLAWGIGSFLIWAIQSVVEGKVSDVPPGVVSVLAILTAGKVIQRFGEKDDSNAIPK